MDFYKDYMVEQYRREDEVESAEKYRLIKSIPGKPSALFTAYRHALANLGAFLYGLGSQLLCRYGSALKSLNPLEVGCE